MVGPVTKWKYMLTLKTKFIMFKNTSGRTRNMKPYPLFIEAMETPEEV